MTQRPKPITVVALLFIAVGTAGLLKDWWPLITPHASEQIARLKAEGLSDFGPAWASRLAAVVGGIFLLRSRNWARWLLVAWMVFHIGLSAMHSREMLLMHTVIFLPIGWVLFRGPSDRYFRPEAA